jgi:hydrogenase maturation protease
MNKNLLVGYGNLDRGDDGIAWHILCRFARMNHRKLDREEYEVGIFSISTFLDGWFNLQLIPEIAEDLVNYQKVVFIDAHTGEIEEPIHIEIVKPIFQNSPLTHHFTPSSCLSLCKELYGKTPQAMLLSVHGYQFNFSHSLSPQSKRLIPSACMHIQKWLFEASSAAITE